MKRYETDNDRQNDLNQRLRKVMLKFNLLQESIEPKQNQRKFDGTRVLRRNDHIYMKKAPGVFSIIIVPLSWFIPMLVLTILNECVSYSGALFISTVSIYSVAFLLSIIHIWIYSYMTRYCSQRVFYIHCTHVVIFYFMFHATMGFYNMYTIEPNIWYVIGSWISGFGAMIEYFICCFQRHHFYYCGDEECNELPDYDIGCGLTYEDLFTIFGVFFMLIWISFMLTPLLLSTNLGNAGRSIDFCYVY